MPYVDQTAPHAGSAELLYTSMFDEPAGTVARTIPRRQMVAANIALAATGIPVVGSVPLAAGTPVNNLGWIAGNTAEVGGSHFWLGLMDVNSNVLAVTPDQTGATFVTANLTVKLNVTNPIVVPQSGLYYLVLSISAGTTMPTSCGQGITSGQVTNNAPIMTGTLASQPTPPAVGANLGAITGAGGGLSIGMYIGQF